MSIKEMSGRTGSSAFFAGGFLGGFCCCLGLEAAFFSSSPAAFSFGASLGTSLGALDCPLASSGGALASFFYSGLSPPFYLASFFSCDLDGG